MILGFYEHFQNFVQVLKPLIFIQKRTIRKQIDSFEKLMIIEDYGNTEVFIKGVERIIKASKDEAYNYSFRFVVRKQLMCYQELLFDKR
jgi:nitrogen regulatory protein PII